MSKRSREADTTDSKPSYDLPNMDAVRRETRRLDDPRADYPLAVKMHDAQLAGAFRRRPR